MHSLQRTSPGQQATRQASNVADHSSIDVLRISSEAPFAYHGGHLAYRCLRGKFLAFSPKPKGNHDKPEQSQTGVVTCWGPGDATGTAASACLRRGGSCCRATGCTSLSTAAGWTTPSFASARTSYTAACGESATSDCSAACHSAAGSHTAPGSDSAPSGSRAAGSTAASPPAGSRAAARAE